jgi:hypothetical protein
MIDARTQLKHSIRMKFGTSHLEPTDELLESIIRDISTISRTRRPTEREWKETVYRYCPSAGTWHYRGLDTSDLNELLGQLGQGKK